MIVHSAVALFLQIFVVIKSLLLKVVSLHFAIKHFKNVSKRKKMFILDVLFFARASSIFKSAET